MYRYAYLSESTNEAGTDLVNSILTSARKNNQRDGLSGLLVCFENRFFQVLEGPRSVVLKRAETIAKDRRHRDMKVIFAGNASSRVFGKWGMGYARPNDLPEQTRKAVSDLQTVCDQLDEINRDDHRVAVHLERFLTTCQAA